MTGQGEKMSERNTFLTAYRYLLIAAAALVVNVSSRPAHAAQLWIPPLGILLDFADYGSVPPGGIFPDIGATTFNNGDFDGNGTTEFTTVFSAGTPAAEYMGAHGAPIYEEGDWISLEITNNDESPWTFRLWSIDFRGNVFAGDFLNLDSGETGLISLVFDLTDFVHYMPGDPPIEIGNTIGIALLVEVSTASSPILLPGQNPDFTAEYSIGSGPEPELLAPVPLPPALPLFASGLGALGLLGWRRKRKAQAAA